MKSLAVVMVLLAFMSVPAMAQDQCDQKQALDMLTRMGTFKQQYMLDHAGKPGGSAKIRDLATRTSHGGTLIGEKKYDAACEHYDQLAREYGFDLSQSNAMSVDEISEYEKHAEAGCDIGSIAARSTQIYRDLAGLKNQLDSRQHAVLEGRVADLSMLMRTDLAAACDASRSLQQELADHVGSD